MKFRLFDLGRALPFSQGYAIKEIHKQTGGGLLAAGEVDEDPQLPGTLLYIKKNYTEGEVKTSESVWHDDGCGVQCLHHRPDDQPWRTRQEDGTWKESDFQVEITQ